MRPGWPWLYAALCAAGAGASLLALSQPRAALAVLVVVLVALAGDAGGWAPFARLVLPRRATQCVVSEPPPRAGRPRVRLIVTAAYDAGGGGLARRLDRAAAPLRRALGGRLPSGPALLCLALAALAGLAAARAAGAEGRWPDLVAIAPTVALLLGAGAYLDTALAGPTPGANAHASAAAAALAVVEELDRLPPRRLAVELVRAGAGAAGRVGERGDLRRRRRAARPHELAVLALGPSGAGRPVHHRREGVLPPRRAHPALLAAAARASEGATAARHGATAAADALRAGWPAIGVSARAAAGPPRAAHTAADTPERVDPAALAATVAYAVRLARAVDREL
ncbi:MAG: hypothetical protein IRZ32_07680 [Solirubrobacteraceae bacterium]|nr:hypothetical protein [Solirubrobacteraceae bacterium]